ncbi:MBOAT membrane-bound O-acyltransferase family protein [Phytophthora infestans]|uniref:MBOAT membrane-bound O-acyltransferase family protein n=1 Tax=Phytophthora infestans TaxID=4787 RepID=A0A833TGK3_PHYIN|nr:MBOAT membrane-bound O-acyltransferase family protein [Phytophthora infestans]
MRVTRRIRRLAEAWIVFRYRAAEQSMEILRGPVDGIALSENFPVDGFRLMVALAGCSLIAPLIHLTRGETSRHLFNVAVGLFAGVFVFDLAVLHTIGTAVVVYLLMMVAPRKLVGRIVLPLLLAYLVAIHYYREFYSPDIVWDSAQMILTLKLSSVAINYSDGGLPKEKKTPTMLKNELQEIPELIPYFGFVFFFPTYLAGPAFEYKDYIYWMKDVRVAPFMVHLRNLVVLVISAAGFFVSLQFPVEEIDSPDFYPKSSWAVRCLRMCIPVVLFRFRYYLAWSLAEAASAAAGVGYVQATGKWNGITNNDLLCVELPTNFRVAINSWNIGVARWINTYIYQRVGLTKSGKSTMLSTMASFFVSALWHGLSPGYYLFFLLGGIYIEVGKQLRRRLRPYFHYTEDRKAHSHAIFLSYFSGTSHPLAFLYDISGMFFTWVAMQYAGVAFEILDVRRCLAIWSSWYFLPHLVSIGLLVFFNLFPQRRSTPTDKKTQ